MYYESNSSHTAFAKLEDVLDGYGLTATHVACVSGTPSEADYARLIRAPLRLGWPVALSIGGELTTHAVVATGFNDAGETRIFNGYASQGWDTLPNVYDPGVIAYVALASSASQLGFQYGDRYGRVPDSWLEAYFIDLLMQGSSLQAVAEGDFDGDGFLNWEEYVAGTDPRDAASRFRVTRLTVENGKPTIEWAPNLPNRAYTLQGKATLDDTWQSLPGADARFFRVLVTAPAD